jgi:hypothetical protein
MPCRLHSRFTLLDTHTQRDAAVQCSAAMSSKHRVQSAALETLEAAKTVATEIYAYMVLLTPRVLAAASTGLSKRAWCGSESVYAACISRKSTRRKREGQ